MSDRKNRVTFQNVTVTYLMSGVSGVEALLQDHSNPVATLDKALSFISENDSSRDTSDLQAFRDSLSTNSGRGPRSLLDTGSKDYSVQQIGENGDVFIRLPVSSLGVQKGERVRVTLSDSGLSVTRC